MKKKLLLILLLGLSLLTPQSANAYQIQTGWIPHEGCPDMSNYHGGWEYLYSNGQHAVNWAYINNKWYYFPVNYDGCASHNTSLFYKGYYYYFKDDCSMACNEWVYCQDIGKYLYADSEGHLQTIY